MAKIVMGKIVEAVTDSVVRQLLPELDQRINALKADIRATRSDITALDAKLVGLHEEMLDRFERQLATINEVSHRVTRVEGKLEGYMEALRTVVHPLKVAHKRKVG